jgi:hypothetical protein
MKIWPCEVLLFILASDFFHAKKSYNMASGFTSPLKEDVLQIFIASNNPLPVPNLNPLTLGSTSVV